MILRLRQILIVKILVILKMMTHDSDKNSNNYQIILIILITRPMIPGSVIYIPS